MNRKRRLAFAALAFGAPVTYTLGLVLLASGLDTLSNIAQAVSSGVFIVSYAWMWQDVLKARPGVDRPNGPSLVMLVLCGALAPCFYAAGVYRQPALPEGLGIWEELRKSSALTRSALVICFLLLGIDLAGYEYWGKVPLVAISGPLFIFLLFRLRATFAKYGL